MEELLWISLCAPYDKVAHAGGQVHNFMVKQFHESGFFHIRLVSFCQDYELDDIDLDDYGIDNDIFVIKNDLSHKLYRMLLKITSATQRFDSCAGLTSGFKKMCVKRVVKKYKKEGYSPSVILMQWTEMILLKPQIQKIFPESKYVCVEEDVTFLKAERLAHKMAGLKKYIQNYYCIHLKRKEINVLKNSDLIVTNNYKDRQLLLNEGVESNKVLIVSPYFNNLSGIKRTPRKTHILFYGAMNRPENYKSAIWFIDKVMPLLLKKFPETVFIVLGNRPPKELQLYQSKNVVITGYVEDPKEFFEQSWCMVAPLIMGAGIKIKILEGFSAGIPVITNTIGIEGIPAKNGKDYLHCEVPEEYSKEIERLFLSEELSRSIGENGRHLIEVSFNLKEECTEFINRILCLLGRNDI